MKKIIALLSVFTLFVSSCSSSDETPVNNTSILVKKIIKTNPGYPNNAEIFTYTYNGNKLWKIDFVEIQDNVINFTYTDIYYYTGDLITKIEYTNNGIVGQYISFEYDNDKLISERSYSGLITGGFYENYKYEYIHNINGTISSKLYTNNYTSGVDDFVLIRKYLIEKNPNQEVSKITKQSFPYWSSTDVYEYNYDNNNSCVKNITGFDKIFVSDGIPRFTGMHNNILSVKTNNIETESTVFQYNLSGFPISSTVSDVGITEFQFFY